jgi:Asp-tRNA(Asn)/Glu-tRNA(Gln) amidotransferase A subunit family amidase
MGKTVTTELAVYAPGKTRNPHDRERTPGGSSSGSIIRPASYCGVYGFKPSFGLISRHGVLALSRLLDHIGIFARSLVDLALYAEPLMVLDARDPDLRPRMRPALRETLAQEPPLPPRLAFVRTPAWGQADGDVQNGFADLCAQLGNRVDEVELPAMFNHTLDWHRTLMETDLAVSFTREYQRGRNKLSDSLREMIKRGQSNTAPSTTFKQSPRSAH